MPSETNHVPWTSHKGRIISKTSYPLRTSINHGPRLNHMPHHTKQGLSLGSSKMSFLPGYAPGCWSNKEITNWKEAGRPPLQKLICNSPRKDMKTVQHSSFVAAWSRYILKPRTQEYNIQKFFPFLVTQIDLFWTCISLGKGCKMAPNSL